MISNIFKKSAWARPRDLKTRGVLGINRRNLEFLFRLNRRRSYKLVDDKILTKQLCSANGIAVPQTYATVEYFGDVSRLDLVTERHLQFVIKPASGAAGRGILIVIEHDRNLFRTAEGSFLNFSALRYHVSSILSGLYSLGGQPDRVILEQRITAHPIFEGLAIIGTPDIRLVMYSGRPAMAMLRLPTRRSRGKANLHQGAVAAGIDLRTGCTLGGVCNNRAVNVHPDTGESISGFRIPHWTRILEMAEKLMEIMEMRYAGVDVVLDAGAGPLVLEVNARPGLAIQIANRAGLIPATKKILLERRNKCVGIPLQPKIVEPPIKDSPTFRIGEYS